MVSWGKAFGTAVTIILMVIVWYIIGFGIALLIIIMAGAVTNLAALADPRILTNPLQALAFLSLASGSNIVVYYLAFFIGVAISALGGMATILKYSAELIVGEVKLTRPIVLSSQVRSAPAVSRPSKFCPTCGNQNVTQAEQCSKCGTQL